VVTPDWFSLCWTGTTQCAWGQVSGTIYGEGSGSAANFSPNTQVATTVGSIAVSSSNNDTSAYVGTTKESNNLTPFYFALPSPICFAGSCSVTFISSDVQPR
jgi:hypothetical protein